MTSPARLLFVLYRFFQGNYDEAGRLYERSRAIREETLGPDHPDVAQSLNNQAQLLREQVRPDRRFHVKLPFWYGSSRCN